MNLFSDSFSNILEYNVYFISNAKGSKLLEYVIGKSGGIMARDLFTYSIGRNKFNTFRYCIAMYEYATISSVNYRWILNGRWIIYECNVNHTASELLITYIIGLFQCDVNIITLITSLNILLDTEHLRSASIVFSKILSMTSILMKLLHRSDRLDFCLWHNICLISGNLHLTELIKCPSRRHSTNFKVKLDFISDMSKYSQADPVESV